MIFANLICARIFQAQLEIRKLFFVGLLRANLICNAQSEIRLIKAEVTRRAEISFRRDLICLSRELANKQFSQTNAARNNLNELKTRRAKKQSSAKRFLKQSQSARKTSEFHFFASLFLSLKVCATERRVSRNACVVESISRATESAFVCTCANCSLIAAPRAAKCFRRCFDLRPQLDARIATRVSRRNLVGARFLRVLLSRLFRAAKK